MDRRTVRWYVLMSVVQGMIILYKSSVNTIHPFSVYYCILYNLKSRRSPDRAARIPCNYSYSQLNDRLI